MGRLSIVISDEVEKAMRTYLIDGSKLKISRGAISKFIEEAIKEKLSRVEETEGV